MNNQFTYPKEKIRFAILTFFFAQGLCMASWASRIPDFKDVFAANYAFAGIPAFLFRSVLELVRYIVQYARDRSGAFVW